jgi:hypothetical protein
VSTLKLKDLLAMFQQNGSGLKVFRPEVKIPIDCALQVATCSCEVAGSEFVRCRLSYMRNS